MNELRRYGTFKEVRPIEKKKKKKIWYIYTMEYYPAIKKNEIMPFTATWMELEIIILSKVSQKKKNKHHIISPMC